MPYIPLQDRIKFGKELDGLRKVIAKHGLSNGELNYLLTSLSGIYLDKHGTSYNTISDVVKALECAKLEFYRRVAAPYEDIKADQNGDMW